MTLVFEFFRNYTMLAMLAIMAYKEERQTREHYLNNGLDFGILHVKELSI